MVDTVKCFGNIAKNNSDVFLQVDCFTIVMVQIYKLIDRAITRCKTRLILRYSDVVTKEIKDLLEYYFFKYFADRTE